MYARADFLEGLLDLDRYSPGDRRGVFRQSLASLAGVALASSSEGVFEGRDPQALARAVRVALADGLLDDLSWLAPAAAGAALYEIAGALPLGAEKRDLGRRVLGMLYEGNAATFVAVATRMAVGSVRGLGGAGIRARVALSLALPASAAVAADPLALALVSRRELVADWVGKPSVGSLLERRLAARLLERAAREAAARARRGDDDALRLFEHAVRRHGGGTRVAAHRNPDALEDAWATLLNDRETLVWRHVAAARGLLYAAIPEVREAIGTALGTSLSPTEWRRGATSLVAGIAVNPERALPAAMALLKGPLLARDPGIATAMIWGAPRAAEAEPEAIEILLRATAKAAPLFVAESLIELRAEVGGGFDEATAHCAEALAATLESSSGDDDVRAFSRAILRELSGEGPGDFSAPSSRLGGNLRVAITRAIEAFVEIGTREAHARAQGVLALAADMMRSLEAIPLDEGGSPIGNAARARAAIQVRELDSQLLESGVLRSLMLLNRRPSDQSGGVRSIDELDERLGEWLLAVETTPSPHVPDGSPPHAALHLRQLRALLHLIDGETTDFDDEPDRKTRVHDRWAATSRRLLARLAVEQPSALRRAIAATVARALDALVRDGAADPADILLYAALRVSDPRDLPVLAEASMHPDVSLLLHAYARFIGALEGAPLRALDAFVAELPQGGSQRTEGLRSSLSRLARALAAIGAATSLRPLADAATSPLGQLEDALERLRQLTASARRRCGDDAVVSSSSVSSAAYPLALAAGRAVHPGADPQAELSPSIAAAVKRAYDTIPRALADVLAKLLPPITDLQIDESRDEVPFLLQPRRPPPRTPDPSSSQPGAAGAWAPETRLPDWLPSRRTLGGFYVHRQIGGGAAGSVFIVTRTEERHDPAAERFALKVPDYDATAARSLSETDFLQIFRQEAGALLALPEHTNLARFVTFDAGARPKPILVMELVEGARCDQVIESRRLTIHAALALLDGVLAGLEAMHEVGVGHLDIKPSNVILRAGRDPVLVDFGLAGRHLRPGCATGSYGAPEVWVGPPDDEEPLPLPADVYSFGCFAYEVLTGETLFEGPNDVALVAAHLTHDGMPPPVLRLAANEATAELAEVLRRCLRKHPGERATATEVRAELRRAGARVAGEAWPIAP